MKKARMNIESFVNEWNYQCNLSELQNQEVLDELYLMVREMIKDNCGYEEENIPKFRFINKKAQIALDIPQYDS